MANLIKRFDDVFERQELILKTHLESGTKYQKYMANHALKFTEDLQIRCKNIVDSNDPNRWNTLKVFLEYNESFMQIQKDLAEALLRNPEEEKPAVIKLLEYYEPKFNGFVVHGAGDDDPTGLIKVTAEDELHFIDDLKDVIGSMDKLHTWDLFNNINVFAILNLELVGLLIEEFSREAKAREAAEVEAARAAAARAAARTEPARRVKIVSKFEPYDQLGGRRRSGKKCKRTGKKRKSTRRRLRRRH